MRKPIPLSELLGRPDPTLERLREGAKAAERTLDAVRDSLPPEVAAHVWGASTEEGRLTVLVDSAGWATRVRYAVPELQQGVGERLGMPVLKVAVRVRPRAGRRGGTSRDAPRS
jgi:predicted nucleic acid-binding Zn ribbon protein